MRSLYLRLGLILCSLFAVIALIFIAILAYLSNLLIDEQAQRTNADLAMYIVREHHAIGPKTLDISGMTTLFGYVTIVNPMVDAYLLDTEGRILTSSSGVDRLQRSMVRLEPLVAYLEGKRSLPIVGDNPRDADHKHVFSVAPIRVGGNTIGYIYVVLARSPFSRFDMMYNSYIVKAASFFFLVSLLFAGITGMLLFRSLTNRLQRLTSAVEAFKERRYAQAVSFPSGNQRNDEIDTLIGAFSEMSERILSQIQLLEQNDQLRRESIANASHDLRTPLAAMQGYLETLLLKGEALSGDLRRQYLEIAHRHGKRLELLIEKMFELARLDSPESRLSMERFPIDEFAADVVQKFRLQAEERLIQLSVQVGDPGCFVEGDVGLIERVFENLIDNALRHTPAHGRIDIAVKRVNKHIAITVADTGEGIAPKLLPRIFDRFASLHDSQQRTTGLGLAIVKRILALHDSEISVQSKLGQGTVFSFSLARVDIALDPMKPRLHHSGAGIDGISCDSI